MAAENVTNVNHKAEADAVADILRKTPTLTRVKGGTVDDVDVLHGATYASPGKLLDLSKGLDIHIGQRVKEHRNAQTGEKTLMFEEGHADATGQPLKVPSAFLLTIPVFRAGAAYQLPCRLRYRVNGSGVTWSYEVHRAQDTLDHALEEACELVREQTVLPVFDGTPE